ncbi:MAG TPA: type II toxin-antitoxin system PemK/MazF family toxin [Candidatus Doudnabacteria bacterium]|nr:type II toxin-antitoxin system PemK/MazF family toxin [Candidatus Doudnabacteria bacterium]
MKEKILFNKWNFLKQQTEVRPDRRLFPKVGEVWFIIWGKNIGYEQNGAGETFSRPGIIITKFNNKMFWVIPLTSKQKALDFYHNFTDPNGVKAAVVISQMKLMSIKRMERFLYKLPKDQLQAIKTKVRIRI